MNKVPNSISLYRYTYIPDLLDMLLNKRLFLPNPKNWSDKTDAAFLEKYANGKEIRALCFFKKGESNQYWELYAKYGCMIEFEAEKLLSKISKKSGFKHRNVSYVEQNKFNLKKYGKILPFVKQLRYKGEDEYRIIWTGGKEGENGVFIPIDFDLVKRIVISGDIKEELARSLISTIHTITKNTFAKKVYYSQLYNNKVWKDRINPSTIGDKK